jgi:hypothetical protein
VAARSSRWHASGSPSVFRNVAHAASSNGRDGVQHHNFEGGGRLERKEYDSTDHASLLHPGHANVRLIRGELHCLESHCQGVSERFQAMHSALRWQYASLWFLALMCGPFEYSLFYLTPRFVCGTRHSALLSGEVGSHV